MKFCPYCGADLIEDAVSFCAECGKQLPTGKSQKEKPKEEPVIKKTGKKVDLTEELLEEDFRMPAVLLFSYSTETNLWSAMETDTGLEMQELLDTKVDEPSHR